MKPLKTLKALGAFYIWGLANFIVGCVYVSVLTQVPAALDLVKRAVL